MSSHGNKVYCKLVKAQVQSIPNAQWTKLTWDVEQYDPGNFFDPNEPTKIKISEDGVYFVTANIEFYNNPNGVRGGRIRKNNSVSMAGMGQVGTGNYKSTEATVASLMVLKTGDYLEVEVYQDSGGPLDVPETYYPGYDSEVVSFSIFKW